MTNSFRAVVSDLISSVSQDKFVKSDVCAFEYLSCFSYDFFDNFCL